MSQQTPYAPRWARVIGRSGTLIGILAVLGGLAGAVFGALGTQTYMTAQTVLVATPTCAAAGAICGGPAFSSGTTQTWSVQGGQVNAGSSAVGSVTLRSFGGSAAQAQSLARSAAMNYIVAENAQSYPMATAVVQLGPSATSAIGTPPGKKVLGDVLLGLVCGALAGALAALAGSRTTIDPLGADNQWQRAAERSGLIRDYNADGATNLGINGPER